MTEHGGAFLLDLENILHLGDGPDAGSDTPWACAEQADAIVSWMLREARGASGQGLSFVLAACSGEFLRRYLGTAQFPHWLDLRLVPFGVKDAAEQLLIAEAYHLLAVGYRDFYIGSGDGAFCELAATADVRTTVLVQHPYSLSRRLEMASTGLRVMFRTDTKETAA